MKLLIADDEIQIRTGLKNEIDWAAIGFTDIYIAKNGLEAIELCEVYKPEVVITDIRMPGIDGLELCRQIMALYNHTEIIIMSGYSDFNYAKQAIEVGVSAYLLKPIDIDELKDTAIKSKEIVEALDNQTETLAGYKRLNRSEELRRLMRLKRDFNNEELTKLKQLISLELDQTVVAAKLSVDAQSVHGINQIGIYLSTMIKELFSHFRVINFYWDRYELSFLLVMDTMNQFNYSKSFIEKEFRTICKLIMNQFGNTVSLGLSSLGKVSDVRELFKECEKSLTHRLYLGREQLLYYENYRNKSNVHISMIDINEIKIHLERFDYEYIKVCFEQNFSRMKVNKISSKDLVRGFCLDMKRLLTETISNRGIELSNIYLECETLREEIPQFVMIDEYKYWLDDLYVSVLEKFSRFGEKRHSRIVIQMLDYIYNNYSNKIYLEAIAKYVGKSKNYVSQQFKKEMEVSIVDYINIVRVEEAKKKLTNTNDMIYQISEDVGFTDYKYFSSIFKKVTNMSPLYYRKKYS